MARTAHQPPAILIRYMLYRKEDRRMMNFKRRLLGSCLVAAAALPVLGQEVIRLSTTTSTENSGLLQYLLPAFEARTNTRVHVISVGTGKALEMAKNGDVDVTLVHARPSEDKFIAEG